MATAALTPPSPEEVLPLWLDELQASDRAKGTIRRYKSAVKGFLAWYASEEQRPLTFAILTPIAFVGYRNELQRTQGRATSTVNGHLSYGPNKTERAIVATTDPQTLPDLSTWYLVTNLPALERGLEAKASFPAADLAEIIRLYGLRMWVEQSYKHVKHALGWSQYQVRSDKAIRRHWQLVWCAFSFCWYHASHSPAHPRPEAKAPSEPVVALQNHAPTQTAATGKKNQCASKNAAPALLASNATSGERLAGTLDYAQTLLERLVASAPTSCVTASAHLA